MGRNCSFGLSSISYLGHVITAHGVEMDPKKVRVVVEWPLPTTTKEVPGFLGLTSLVIIVGSTWIIE